MQFSKSLKESLPKNMVFVRLPILFIFSILAIYNAYPKESSDINFEHISVKDGLIHNHVLSIYQDRKGYIWIGTFGGLQRYDGLYFRTFGYTKEDSNTISNNSIHAIVQDASQDVLWLGTEGGLDRFDLQKEQFTHFRNLPGKENSISYNNVRNIIPDGDSLLWIGTYGGGVNSLNLKTLRWKHFQNEHGNSASLVSNKVNALYIDNVRQLWIGTEGGGLSLLDPVNGMVRNFTPNGLPGSIPDDLLNCILPDNRGILWMGSWNKGVVTFDPATEHFNSYEVNPNSPNAIHSSIVRSSVEDAEGKIWFATFGGGLSRYNRETSDFTTYMHSSKSQNSLVIDLLWTIFEDRTGTIWVGTFGDGINLFDPSRKSFENYHSSEDTPTGLSSNIVSSLIESRNGEIWMGTLGGGLNRLNRSTGQFTHYLENADPKKAMIRKIFEDSRGSIWVGTDQGLYCLNPKTNEISLFKHQFNNPTSITNNSIYSIGEDKTGAMWVGIWNAGLDRIKSVELKKQNPDEVVFDHFTNNPADSTTLASNTVWTSYTDRSGNIWFGSDLCFDRFDYSTETFVHINYYNYSSILEDGKGNLWLGTLGGGIAKYDRLKGTVEFYSSNKTKDFNTIISMAMDREGIIWLVTQKGMVKFNPLTKDYIPLDLSMELKENEYRISTVRYLSTGELLFGGDHGVSIIEPIYLARNNRVPVVEITGLYLLDERVQIDSLYHNKMVLSKSLSYTNTVSLSYKSSIIRIEFAALYFISRNKLQYAYMLDGYDRSWKYTRGELPFATYNNLSQGNYTFRVKASLQNDNWSEERLLEIEILPPLYLTWWAKIIYILLFMVIVSTLYLNRVRNIKLHEIRKYLSEKQEKEFEITQLNQKKLDTELEYKKKELASYSLHNIRKNEKLTKLRDELQSITKIALPRTKNRIKEIIKEVEENIDDTDNWDYFEQNFDLLHNDFLKRFATDFPNLTHKDLKICAFIRMNLDNKEIAKNLNITQESLGVSRTRLRKKMNIDKDVYLNDYILRY